MSEQATPWVMSDQFIASERDWVRWMRHGMPKAIKSQVYTNSRGNFCVGGYPFRRAQEVIRGTLCIPGFEMFKIVKRGVKS